MNFTYTKWLCRDCRKRQKDGYGGECKTFDDPSEDSPCEECGRKVNMLCRYRVLEKDIRFLFISSSQHSTDFHVLVDGRYVMTYEDVPVRLVYVAHNEDRSSFEKAKAAGYNVQGEDDWWVNFGAWPDTIHWHKGITDNEDRIPKDILEAFRIFNGTPKTRRAMYKSEIVPCASDDPDGWESPKGHWQKQINGRVEYY